jgi:hypothetical protein
VLLIYLIIFAKNKNMKTPFFLKRIYVRFKSMDNKINKLSDEQKKVFIITSRVIPLITTNIVNDSDNNSFYMSNKEKGMFIVLNKNNIRLINGVYHYDIWINEFLYHKIIFKIRKRINKEQEKINKDINHRVNLSLDNIISSIN